MEFAIPLAALIISIGAIGLSVLTQRSHVQRVYVEALEGRIALMETRIKELTDDRAHLLREVAMLKDENHHLRTQVDLLQSRLNHMTDQSS